MKRSQILPAYPLVYMEPPKVLGGEPSLRVTLGMTARVAIAAEVAGSIYHEAAKTMSPGMERGMLVAVAREALDLADAILAANDEDLKASIEGRKIV
jgi:hypothetical protein